MYMVFLNILKIKWDDILRVAIIGSRDANEDCYNKIIENLPAECSEIISGGAKGIDTYAKMVAQNLGIAYREFLPDYAKYGKYAPIQRNKLIIENADMVLGFWNFQSRGTQSTIAECIKNNIPFKVIEL